MSDSLPLPTAWPWYPHRNPYLVRYLFSRDFDGLKGVHDFDHVRRSSRRRDSPPLCQSKHARAHEAVLAISGTWYVPGVVLFCPLFSVAFFSLVTSCRMCVLSLPPPITPFPLCAQVRAQLPLVRHDIVHPGEQERRKGLRPGRSWSRQWLWRRLE